MEAAVACEEGVGRPEGVGSDQEVGDNPLTRSANSAVPLPAQACLVGDVAGAIRQRFR